MIFTARQLEELHKSNGHVVLPYRARLTPMAQDWVRAKKILVGYSENGAVKGQRGESENSPKDSISPGRFLWWCEGPCGPAKAALMSQARESELAEIATAADANNLPSVITEIASVVKENRAAGAILVVQFGAAAMVMGNRCGAIRAVLGTSLEAVEQGVRQIAANVLVIEHASKSLPQVKNMIGRFVRAKRELSDATERQLKDLASCA
jgi:ribose 5-phosphate isomerase RpiB